MAARDLDSYFTSRKTGIPELVKAPGNVTASDASAENAELKSLT